MVELAARVAQCALSCFEALPPKCKPRVCPDGRREWTPLSAVIAVRTDVLPPQVECIALATGTKCLPAGLIKQCDGQIVHDSHAEVLALRGFNRWLLEELQYQLDHQDFCSPYLARADQHTHGGDSILFHLREHVSFHFYTTEAPCGDASMDLLIEAKGPEDSVPWETEADLQSHESPPSMLGRGQFDVFGAIRRKPARADASASLSKSCTDKLTIKQVTSLLAYPADIFFEITPSTFIRTLIVPHDQYHQQGYERAFTSRGRANFSDQCKARYFDIVALPVDFPMFPFNKNGGLKGSLKASNISTVWIKGAGATNQATVEILLNGVKQGFKQLSPDARKQSVLCRRQMAVLGQKISTKLGSTPPQEHSQSYHSAKSGERRHHRQQSKNMATTTLGNWVRNTGDDEWLI